MAAGTACTVTCDEAGVSPTLTSGTGTTVTCVGTDPGNEYSAKATCGAAELVYKVKQTFELTIEGSAADAKTPEFKDGVVTELAGVYGVSKESVEVVIDAVDVRRLEAAPGRRLAAKVTITSTVTVKDKSTADKVATAMGDTAALDGALKAAGEAAGVKVTSVTASAPTTTTDFVTDTGATGTGGTGTGSTAAAEEEGDNSGVIIGAVVGAIGGLGLLGAAFFFYSKKTSSQE